MHQITILNRQIIKLIYILSTAGLRGQKEKKKIDVTDIKHSLKSICHTLIIECVFDILSPY